MTAAISMINALSQSFSTDNSTQKLVVEEMEENKISGTESKQKVNEQINDNKSDQNEIEQIQTEKEKTFSLNQHQNEQSTYKTIQWLSRYFWKYIWPQISLRMIHIGSRLVPEAAFKPNIDRIEHSKNTQNALSSDELIIKSKIESIQRTKEMSKMSQLTKPRENEKCTLCGRWNTLKCQPIIKSSNSQMATNQIDGLDPFRKMIKIKVPKFAVINKMKRVGVDAAIIREYEVTGKLASDPTTASLGEDADAVKEQTQTQTVDPVLTKYNKMKRLKLPEQAIRNRMKRDGLSQEVIDKFFGITSSSNMIIQQNDKMTVKSKVNMKSEQKWPEGLDPKPEVIPNRRMKNLQWTKVDPFRVATTIWSECDDQNIDFDQKGFEALFGQKVVAKKRTLQKNKKMVDDRIHILDPKRSHNVEIFVFRLKLKPETVRDCLLKLDDTICSAEQIEKLKFCVPTPQEAARFDRVKPKNVGKLAKSDFFFFVLKDIDKNLPQRLELWEFKLNFDKIMKTERGKVKALQRAHQCIQQSKSLRVLLSTILALGNHMNGGTNRGRAHGFNLSLLPQLTRTRSTDNKMTFMEYLYLFFEETGSEVLQIPEEWSPLHEAVRVDIPFLRKNVAQIGAKLKMIEHRIDTVNDQDITGDDQFNAVMKPFHILASRQYEEMKKEHAQVINDLSILAAFLGETKDMTAAFLKVLEKFRRDFVKTEKQRDAKRKKAEEGRKSEQWRAERKRARSRPTAM